MMPASAIPLSLLPAAGLLDLVPGDGAEDDPEDRRDAGAGNDPEDQRRDRKPVRLGRGRRAGAVGICRGLRRRGRRGRFAVRFLRWRRGHRRASLARTCCKRRVAYRRGSARSTAPGEVGPSPSARPALHRVRRGGNHIRAGHLVLPRLLLGIPEHPEVADVAGEAGPDRDQIANERGPVVDSALRAGVDGANAEKSHARRLATPAADEVHGVRDPGGEADEDLRHEAATEDEPDDQADDVQDHAVDEEAAEAVPEVGARPGRSRRRAAGRRNGLCHYSGLPVEYLKSWNAHRAAKNTNTAHTGIRTRCQRHATSRTIAIATTRNAPGL